MHEDLSRDDQGSAAPSRSRRLLRWKIVIPCVLVLLLILAPLVYRQRRLAQVPDIGDPFPVSEVTQPIPEEENAWLAFEEAFALHKEVADEDFDEYRGELYDLHDHGWDPTHNQLKNYLTLNRPALQKWRNATEKEDSQVMPFSQVLDDSTYITKIQASRELVRLCQFEIGRLTNTAKPADALSWLRAGFRCSGLVTRNASSLHRLVGIAYFAISANAAEKWMQHPDVTREELFELLSIVQTADQMMEKPSTMIKMDYLIARQAYADWSYEKMMAEREQLPEPSPGETYREPPLASQWETWLLAEPEFSRRLSAHSTANYLTFIDDPRRERPPLLDDNIFDESALGITPAGRLPAQRLIELRKAAKLINNDGSGIAGILDSIDRHRARHACLQVAVASQAFYRDHGEFPQQLADLQPEYLSSLPDDPYAPQPTPVIYRRSDEGAVIYSRFTNETDDGATMVNFDEARGAELLDFGLRIRKPRLPPVVAPRP